MTSRRFRREAGLFAFEGPELVACAFDADVNLERLFVAPEASDEVLGLADHAQTMGINVGWLAEGVLESVADAKTPQGCIATARRTPIDLSAVPGPSFVIVVDQLQDPGNLGAIVRVAEGCGADALIVSNHSADPYGPKALRAGSGSTFRVPVVEGGDVGEILDALAEREIAVLATSSHGGVDFATFAWPSATALLFGNEGAGLEQSVIDRCSETLQIPLSGALESLNVAVAAGILTMAAKRRLVTSETGPLASTMNSVPMKDSQ